MAKAIPAALAVAGTAVAASQMGKSSAPAPPNPNVVGANQTATNIGTSIANTAGGQVNQVTPDGSLTYSQRGTYDYVDPISGRVHAIPQYTATTALTPEAQAIHDENLGAQMGLAETANQQAGFLKDYLGTPADFDTEAIEGRIDELARNRLDPRFVEEEDALRGRLTNQGINVGSEAYDREMRNFGQYRNDAYNNLALTGRAQAFQEIGASRNQPINEITALLSGSQVAPPNVSISTPDRAATTDYAGIVNNNYNQRFAAFQSEQQRKQQLMGGLFSLAGSGIQTAGAFI